MINIFYWKRRDNIVILFVVLLTISLQGCFFSRGKKVIIPDGKYFQSVSAEITKALIGANKDAVKRVVIIDIVNTNGKVSILGRLLTFKLFESFLKETKSPLVPRGEILATLSSIGSNPASDYEKESLQKLAEALNASAFILGELVDIGVKIELNLKMIDAKTGEVISAASVPIERQDMVVSLYETY